MDFQRMILLFMEYCLSKQLRPKTMHAYEKTLRLFAKWLQENEEITKADAVKEMHIRRYILELQSRGKYTACSDEHSKKINFPENRSDYHKLTATHYFDIMDLSDAVVSMIEYQS